MQAMNSRWQYVSFSALNRSCWFQLLPWAVWRTRWRRCFCSAIKKRTKDSMLVVIDWFTDQTLLLVYQNMLVPSINALHFQRTLLWTTTCGLDFYGDSVRGGCGPAKVAPDTLKATIDRMVISTVYFLAAQKLSRGKYLKNSTWLFVNCLACGEEF